MKRCPITTDLIKKLEYNKIFVSTDRILEISKTYLIEGSPLALKRPRFFERRVYDSQKANKLHIGLMLKKQHDDRDPFKGILHFDIIFYFPFPQAVSKKNLLKTQQYHIYKPDLSNLIKMVEDVCVDADIIADDSMIASMFSVKLYDDNPRTTFIITTIKGGNAIESNTYEE